MIDLRLGDCLAPDGLPALADRSVGVSITDPPFDKRTHRAAVETGERIPGKRCIDGELPFAPLDASTLPTLASQLVRVTRRWIVVFCGERQIEAWSQALEAAGGRVVRVGVALRSNPRPQMSGDRPSPAVEPLVIAYASRGKMRWNGRGKAAWWEAPQARFDTGGKTEHPTQKSLHLMRSLVADFADPGELVCDPFAGSGSTALACVELNRAFLGWEIDPNYHALASERIARARGELQARLDRPLLAASGSPAVE